jgi:hypothetical protein
MNYGDLAYWICIGAAVGVVLVALVLGLTIGFSIGIYFNISDLLITHG